MTLPSLSSVTNQWWGSVCKYVNKAVIFLDDETAETLHWNGGLTRLVQAGALDVKNFSPFESALPNQKKAVFLLNRPLHGITFDTLHDIIKASKLHYCVVISSVHFSVHYFVHHGHNDGDEDVLMENLEDRVRMWMGDRNYAVELLFYPMFLAPICPSLFVTPPFSQLFPPFPSDLYTIQQLFQAEKHGKSEKKFPESLHDLDLIHLPLNLQSELKIFAHCLNSFLEQLGCKEDCFTVGHYSRIIVNVLDSLPAARTRRKNVSNKVSIVLIDRTLDLVGPTGHGIDTLLDRIVNLLPRLPGHLNDVAINMSNITCAKSDLNSENEVLVPGCLAQCQDAVASAILNSLVINKHKECLMDINRQLVEAISKEKLTDSLAIKPGRLNHEVLENHINHFKMKPLAIANHAGLLQQALAATQALQHSNNSQLDQLYGIEKGLLHNLGDTAGGQSALGQIIQLIKTRKDRSICLEDILVLLIHVYSLAGDRVSDYEEEYQLKTLLAEVFIEDAEVISETLKELLGEDVDELSAHTAVEQLLLKLKDVGDARTDLKKYRSVFEPGSKAQPACYMPLFRQILDDIFNPARPELVDVEYKTMGLKDMIKTGFSLFMNVNKPRPCDNPMMIIFVVGGITTTEVRQIRDTVVAQKPNVQILVGSTRLLKPHDVLDLLLHSYEESNNDWK